MVRKVVLLQQQCSARARLDQGRRAARSQGCCKLQSGPMSPHHERQPPPGMAAGRGLQHGVCPAAPCTTLEGAGRAVHPNGDRINPLQRSRERLAPVELIAMKEGQGVMGQACRVPGQEKHGGHGGHRRWGQADPPRGAASAFGAKHQHPRGLPRCGGDRAPVLGCAGEQRESQTGHVYSSVSISTLPPCSAAH